MDLEYFSVREKHALHMATISTSKSARVAHRAFAKAYGLILAAKHFPESIARAEKDGLAPDGLAPSDAISLRANLVSNGTANDAA